MTNFTFETDQFRISDKSIHLLRSGFNYATIDFSIITSIEITKGRQVNNWLILLITGIGMTTFAIYTSVKILYEFFFANNFVHFYVEQFLIPVFPLFLGFYCLYFSLQTGPVMLVDYKGKIKKLALGPLNKNKKLEELISFFESHSKSGMQFRSNYRV